eukprot:10326152-Prorocentrum_lima.AAC.1
METDWEVDGKKWVEDRVKTSTTYIEKNVKEVMLSNYFSKSGRFDIEGLKIDFTEIRADKNKELEITSKMKGMDIC